MANTRKRSLWDTKIVGRALRDAVAKLNPRTMMKNPVMFVVEIGSLITTIYTVADVVCGHHALRFDLQITLWLWLPYSSPISPRPWRRDAGKRKPARCGRRSPTR